MKKILSIVIALTLVLAMGSFAFAEETTGTITIQNSQPGATYSAYKIFDVESVVGESGTTYVYTIPEGSPWYSVVQAYAATDDNFSLTKFNDVYMVEIGSGYSSAGLSAYLKNHTPGGLTAQGTATVDTDATEATISGLPFGYYFVTSSIGAVAALTTADHDVTISEKNPFDFDKTEDKTNFDIGDDVTYTVTATIPSTEGIANYTYKFTDTMTEGLDFNNDVAIQIVVPGTGENDPDQVLDTLTAGTDYTVTVTDNQHFEINFITTSDNFKNNAGKTLKITYSAKLNDKAVAVISDNEITLKYGHDNNFEEITDDVVLYSSKIVIDKYEKGSESTKLKDAEFVLYKLDGETKLYYKLNGSDVEWVTDKTQATVATTDENGAADFKGLANGTYYLEETKAPTGYTLLKDPVEVKLNGITDITENTMKAEIEGKDDLGYMSESGPVEVTTETFTVTSEVENAKGGIILPSTGGIGTTIFYVVGAVLVIGAAIILISKRRAGEAENVA